MVFTLDQKAVAPIARHAPVHAPVGRTTYDHVAVGLVRSDKVERSAIHEECRPESAFDAGDFVPRRTAVGRAEYERYGRLVFGRLGAELVVGSHIRAVGQNRDARRTYVFAAIGRTMRHHYPRRSRDALCMKRTGGKKSKHEYKQPAHGLILYTGF